LPITEDNKPILFSLEHCIKCQQTKDLLTDNTPIHMVTLPHDFSAWYDVFEDLQKTAPILWENGIKIVGYLRIRKWLQDNHHI
jgi:glutaredoxin